MIHVHVCTYITCRLECLGKNIHCRVCACVSVCMYIICYVIYIICIVLCISAESRVERGVGVVLTLSTIHVVRNA